MFCSYTPVEINSEQATPGIRREYKDTYLRNERTLVKSPYVHIRFSCPRIFLYYHLIEERNNDYRRLFTEVRRDYQKDRRTKRGNKQSGNMVR